MEELSELNRREKIANFATHRFGSPLEVGNIEVIAGAGHDLYRRTTSGFKFPLP